MGVITNGSGGGGGNVRYDKTTQFIQVKDDQGWFNWRKAVRAFWDAVANNYATTTGQGRVSYTSNGDYGTLACTYGSQTTDRIFITTPVPQDGTLHVKGTITATGGAWAIFHKNTSISDSGNVTVWESNGATGDFEFTALVSAGTYFRIGTTYETASSTFSLNVAISEFYVD